MQYKLLNLRSIINIKPIIAINIYGFHFQIFEKLEYVSILSRQNTRIDPFIESPMHVSEFRALYQT